MRGLLAALACACSLIASGAASAVTIFADEFNDTSLHPGWQVTAVQGVDFLLNSQPGRLVSQIHFDGKPTTVTNGNAARLSLDAPAGDFTMETAILSGGSDGKDGAGFFLTTANKDTVAWRYSVSNILLDLFYTKTNLTDQITSVELPVYLRMRRVGNILIFEAKGKPEAAWSEKKRLTLESVPQKVGLIFPNYEVNYFLAFGYFHLEAAAPDGPAPVLSSLSPSPARPGSTVFLNGQNFLPGYSAILLDGEQTGGFFPTSLQGVFQVPLNLPVGTHTLAVQTGTAKSNLVSLSVPSSDLLFLPLGNGSGDVNGDGSVDVSDAVLVLRRAVGLE